jgi:NADPH2:quinone reductase
MKALVCQSDRNLVWQTVKEPVPAEDELLVSVKAASVNFPDALVIQGKYQVRLEPPFIPGMEVAGEVLATGAATRGFTVGDRVSAVLPGFGGFAERITVSPDHTFQIPDKLPFDVAACVPSVLATVYYGLVNRAAFVTGETVLVLGAAGGIGSASITLAKKLGAKVIAAVGTEDKAAIARSLGADHVINYSQCSLKEKVKDITQGQGADIVIDPVGGDTTEQALRAIAWDGRHLVIGFAAGDIPVISTHLLLLKSASMVGVNFGGFTSNFGSAAKKICETVNNMMATDHSIWPLISGHIPMQAGSDAIASLPGRTSIGKIVLTLDG